MIDSVIIKTTKYKLELDTLNNATTISSYNVFRDSKISHSRLTFTSYSEVAMRESLEDLRRKINNVLETL